MFLTCVFGRDPFDTYCKTQTLAVVPPIQVDVLVFEPYRHVYIYRHVLGAPIFLETQT